MTDPEYRYHAIVVWLRLAGWFLIGCAAGTVIAELIP